MKMPQKAPNKANLESEQSLESQEFKSRNGRGGGAKTKPIGSEWWRVAREEWAVASEAERRGLTARQKRQTKPN
jgi:hypothetical protein